MSVGVRLQSDPDPSSRSTRARGPQSRRMIPTRRRAWRSRSPRSTRTSGRTRVERPRRPRSRPPQARDRRSAAGLRRFLPPRDPRRERLRLGCPSAAASDELASSARERLGAGSAASAATSAGYDRELGRRHVDPRRPSPSAAVRTRLGVAVVLAAAPAGFLRAAPAARPSARPLLLGLAVGRCLDLRRAPPALPRPRARRLGLGRLERRLLPPRAPSCSWTPGSASPPRPRR